MKRSNNSFKLFHLEGYWRNTDRTLTFGVGSSRPGRILTEYSQSVAVSPHQAAHCFERHSYQSAVSRFQDVGKKVSIPCWFSAGSGSGIEVVDTV